LSQAVHNYSGLSAGEPIEDHGDLFGSTVQLAARLCAYAEPEQILISKLLQDHYEGRESFFDLGEIILKGFNQAIRVYSVEV